MRIAAAQILTGRDPQDNLRLVRESVAEAAAQSARIVVFPEATMRAFGAGRLDEIAEPLEGPWASAVADSAREHGVLVVVGMFTPGRGGRVRNTLLVTGPTGGGEEIHTGYDKIHLFDAFGFAESDTVEPGDATRVVTVDGVGVGLSVCYDIRFPGQYTALASAGARLTLCSASWGAGPGKVDQWRLLARARALDSTTFLLAVGQADPAVEGVEVKRGAPTGVGHSLLVGPDGTVRSEAGPDAGLMVVEVDDDEVTDIRKVIPVLANGRVTEESHGKIPR
ncbi:MULTISPECIES: carbon-nitrogen hydrolase family protein [Dietzia]|uniref:Carbon-nitrogen hydrolase family protein n=1 Tax=Dietzia cinnamea TaxID=321318 RepID=A0A4R3ZT48_9ACTN|nr:MULTISPECIES: carbon-nitrogen hydrolase family protein [Dietzia]MBB1020211.1 carbon-nitrogen hydrolase family protein [Dietzia sp. E1]MBC7305935.1 carbon-nitrogen hydrolase family protein [Dietzia sp.]MCT1639176.1 carbon-nitrogen hydrolase family protein [Dietzia cinnamea]MCT1711984.1 carbon-nitrogen hydrolase family protein [Dietzia cinnamea]MCT1862838.1 carbon-nitrogen hydrolase family protein [Dietzia cinnamea]